MSEVRFSPKQRARHLRNIQKAVAVGQIENTVYKPFKTGWTHFKTAETLHGWLLCALVVGIIILGGLLEGATPF